MFKIDDEKGGEKKIKRIQNKKTKGIIFFIVEYKEMNQERKNKTNKEKEDNKEK